VIDRFEDFEDDAVGSTPDTFYADWGHQNYVVESGDNGIPSPDGSNQYTLFSDQVSEFKRTSFWFHDGQAMQLRLTNVLSADFYIDPTLALNEEIYLATTFYVNGAYKGEIGLGCRLLENSSSEVVFQVTRYQGRKKGPQRIAIQAGWYHLEMRFSDVDEDGRVDVTCTVSEMDGSVFYSHVEPTIFDADETYTTAGYQIQAGTRSPIALRVDNLRAREDIIEYVEVDVTAHANWFLPSKKTVMVDIAVEKVVSATLGGVEATKLQSTPNGRTRAWFPAEGMEGLTLFGTLEDGTLITGEVEFNKPKPEYQTKSKK
jgi:hypothetical protein